MERSYWVTFVIIALMVGLVMGFGLASKASRIPELEKHIQTLTKENADLKAKLTGLSVTPAPASGATPAAAGSPAKP